jgi:hypothetical protein
MSIYDEIQTERQRQDVKWGGASHDDTHIANDWANYIIDHAKAACVSDFRTEMIKVAALAVAAIEAADRSSNGPHEHRWVTTAATITTSQGTFNIDRCDAPGCNTRRQTPMFTSTGERRGLLRRKKR